MCKQSILYKEGRCSSASPALARNFNGSLHLYSKEFSFMRALFSIKRYFNFSGKIQNDQYGLRGHSRLLEAKSRKTQTDILGDCKENFI